MTRRAPFLALLVVVASLLLVAMASPVTSADGGELLSESRQSQSVGASGYDRFLAPEGRCANAENRSGSVAQQERAMRCLINFARSKAGLRKVSPHRMLSRAADLKASQLLRCQTFAHAPCKGKTAFSVFRTAGYANPSVSWSGGENIAWGSSYLGSPRSIMKAWLNSTGHRRNIMKRGWHDQGVALRSGKFLGYSGVAVWVSHFGTRS